MTPVSSSSSLYLEMDVEGEGAAERSHYEEEEAERSEKGTAENGIAIPEKREGQEAIEQPEPKRKRFFTNVAEDDDEQTPGAGKTNATKSPVPTVEASRKTSSSKDIKGKKRQLVPDVVEILDDDSGEEVQDDDKQDVKMENVPSTSALPTTPPKPRIPRNGKDFRKERYLGSESFRCTIL